jgi:hypothetical protein
MQDMPLFSPMFASKEARNTRQFCSQNLKVQALLQTQQINTAIQLLKMQYEAIMASVHRSQCLSERAAIQTPTSQESAPLDQSSFASDFELPRLDSFSRQLGSSTTALIKNSSNKKRDLYDIERADPEGSESSKKVKKQKRDSQSLCELKDI